MMTRLDLPKNNLIVFISFDRHNALVVDSVSRRILGALTIDLHAGSTWEPSPRKCPIVIQETRKQRRIVARAHFRDCKISQSDIDAIEGAYFVHYTT